MAKDEEKLVVRQFKDGRNSWWCDGKHWQLIEGKLVLAAGGLETSEVRLHMEKYLRLKKLL